MVSDGFEVLIKKINLSWIRRVRAQGTHPTRRLRLLTYAGYACYLFRNLFSFRQLDIQFVPLSEELLSTIGTRRLQSE